MEKEKIKKDEKKNRKQKKKTGLRLGRNLPPQRPTSPTSPVPYSHPLCAHALYSAGTWDQFLNLPSCTRVLAPADSGDPLVGYVPWRACICYYRCPVDVFFNHQAELVTNHTHLPFSKQISPRPSLMSYICRSHTLPSPIDVS